jgi:S-formylglutathione hydrolase FrmB
MGIPMGGYGAILMAEKHPAVIAAVAAISPAVWTNYSEAHTANPGAYASPEAFAAADAVTHARSLAGIPVPVASGTTVPGLSGPPSGGHPVTRSPGHPVTRSPGQPVTPVSR